MLDGAFLFVFLVLPFFSDCFGFFFFVSCSLGVSYFLRFCLFFWCVVRGSSVV